MGPDKKLTLSCRRGYLAPGHRGRESKGLRKSGSAHEIRNTAFLIEDQNDLDVCRTEPFPTEHEELGNP